MNKQILIFTRAPVQLCGTVRCSAQRNSDGKEATPACRNVFGEALRRAGTPVKPWSFIITAIVILSLSMPQMISAEMLEAGPCYRTDIPEIIRFVNIPETATGKLDFPIQILTPEEQERLKEKHQKQTQFMVIGTAGGELGILNIEGNKQNFKDGNPTQFVGGEFPDGLYQDGRIILYLKGLIKGEYLLTGRYDTTKNNQDHLYKYINPERYYPVYGDNSILTNDADSQGRVFVKIEKEESFAELGDYSTEEFGATQLARYNRVLSGVKAHMRSEDFVNTDDHRLESQIITDKEPATKFNMTTFLANTTQEETEDTFSANGISGPFYLSKSPVLEYTERIRIEIRDKNKSDTILNARYLIRDKDYSIEYDRGRIFLHAPVPSRDENDDPVYIVARYEYSANTDLDYNIAGNRIEAYLFKQKDGPHKLMLAGQTINEQKDLYNWGMYSVDGILHLTQNTRLLSEYAFSTKSSEEDGQAARVEIQSNLFENKLMLQGYAAQINEDFFNPVSVTESGVQKYGALAHAYLTDDMYVIADNWFSRSMQAHTYDRKTSVDCIWNYKNFFLSSGYRLKEFVDQYNVIRDTQTHGVETSQGIALCDDIILSNTLSYEREYKHDYPSQKPLDYQRDIFTLSPRLDIKMNEDMSLYVRHDLITNKTYDRSYIYDSNTTKVGLSRITPEGIRNYVEYGFTGQGTATTTIGQEATTPITDGMSLSSYMNTNIEPYHTTENIGYNSKIRLLDNLFTNINVERNKITGNQGYSDYNSQSASLEYVTKKNTLGGKFEHRDENAVSRYNLLANASLGFLEDAQVFSKGEYSWKRDKDTRETSEDYKRAVAGVAYRPISFNNINFLGKYEYKENLYQDNAVPLDAISHLGSAEGVFEPYKYLDISGKYAIKHYTENSDNLSTPSLTDMFTVRPSLKFTEYIDVTGIYRYLRNYDTNTTKYLTSLEVGLTLFKHLRIAGGYNFTEYDDRNLPDEDYKGYGPYINCSLAIMEPGTCPFAQEDYGCSTESRIDKIKTNIVRMKVMGLSDEKLEFVNQKFRDAESLYKQHKYKEAKTLYNEIILEMRKIELEADAEVKNRLENEEEIASLFKQAEALYNESKYRDAEKLYKEILEKTSGTNPFYKEKR